MAKSFYPDTSIWLDFFEKRDEPNLPKGKFARRLISQIIADGNFILYSDVIRDELEGQGYPAHELNRLFQPFRKFLLYTESTKKQFGKAKDLSKKRNIPIFDALHALIARDNKAVMITRDKHFSKLLDITKYKRPEDIS